MNSPEDFLDNLQTLYMYATSNPPRCISRTLDNMAWVHSDQDDEVHLIDHTCTQRRTLKLDMKISGITTHSLTGDLYCCSNNCVRKVNSSTGETTLMFTTDEMLSSIACTKDEYMLVASRDTVSKRKFDRQVLYEISSPFILFPCISICNITDHVAVNIHDGVMVLNDYLQEQYIYKGQNVGHKQTSDVASYTAVFADKHLLVGHNNNVSVLNAADGRHIKTITSKEMTGVSALAAQQKRGYLSMAYNDQHTPGVSALGVQQEHGYLWMGYYDEYTHTNKIMSVKYFNDQP